jgi:cytosine/adenosine deaminase-related metal-dependent hydrolase
MTRELLIKGGYVATGDPKLDDLPDGDVLIRDDIVVAVGSALATSAPDAELIDARGRLVIPGLVDTHHDALKSELLNTRHEIPTPLQHHARWRPPPNRRAPAPRAAPGAPKQGIRAAGSPAQDSW